MKPSPSPALTIRELLARTSPYLESKGSGSPRLDAELLLAETLGVDGYFNKPFRMERLVESM